MSTKNTDTPREEPCDDITMRRLALLEANWRTLHRYVMGLETEIKVLKAQAASLAQELVQERSARVGEITKLIEAFHPSRD